MTEPEKGGLYKRVWKGVLGRGNRETGKSSSGNSLPKKKKAAKQGVMGYGIGGNKAPHRPKEFVEKRARVGLENHVRGGGLARITPKESHIVQLSTKKKETIWIRESIAAGVAAPKEKILHNST